jgi:hypothetical protein
VQRILVSLLAVATFIGCTPRNLPEPAAPAGAAGPDAAVLRLIDITPRDGAHVDSGTVIVARLAYHIPDFDPNRHYSVGMVFAGAGGRMFSRGGGHSDIHSPIGVVTVRQSMEEFRSSGGPEPETPLTGTFLLFEMDPLPIAAEQQNLTDRRETMVVRRSAAVRVQSRAFYYNGTGPVRSPRRNFPEVIEAYWTYKPHKALAVAYDTQSRWTFGYSFGHASRESAAERALAECRTSAEQREISAPCRLVVVDDEEPGT